MKKFGLFLVVGMLLVVLLPLVSGAVYTDNTTKTLATSEGASNAFYGPVVNFTNSGTISNVCVAPGSRATRIVIWDYTGAALGSVLSNTSISSTTGGNCSDPGLSVTAATLYRITSSIDSAALERKTTGGVTFPIVGVPNGKVIFYNSSIRAPSAGTWSTVTTNVYEIYNISLTVADPNSPSISFQGQTPNNNTAQYVVVNNNLTLNSTSSNFGGSVNTTHYLFNGSGALVGQNNGTGQINYTSVFSGLSVGVYYFNATAFNGSSVNFTDKRIFYIYDLVYNNITSPVNNSNVSSKYVNFTWTNVSVTPSGTNVVINNFTIELFNSNGVTFNRTIGNTTQLNFSNYDIYSQNLPIGYYWVRVVSQDNQGRTISSMNKFNLIRNTLINITAVNAIGGGSIGTFDGWLYQSETGLNVTYSTSSGVALVDFLKGNVTAFINATGYSLSSNITLSGFNVTGVQYDKIFVLYETNTLNITFYDQANPGVVLSGISISLDLISSLYSNTYSTTNGTLYLTLLTPEDYILRYEAPNYVERFYQITVINRSFQNVELYLINGSVNTNVTITVVNEVLNPVSGAVVKASKYYLPTNTYIVQQIGTTNVEGEVVMGLTLNNEYYRFIIEYPSGSVVEITDPAYITTTSLIIPISQGNDLIEEYVEYAGITNSLVFNDVTNNFRLDFSDSTNTASYYCLYVFKVTNSTQSNYNSSCTTASSGTILVGVQNTSGVTYLAKATYTQIGIERLLNTAIKEFRSITPFSGTSGLWLQLIITIGFALLFLLNAPIGIIMTAMSFVFGKLIGINIFTWGGIYALIAACVGVAILVSMKK